MKFAYAFHKGSFSSIHQNEFRAHRDSQTEAFLSSSQTSKQPPQRYPTKPSISWRSTCVSDRHRSHCMVPRFRSHGRYPRWKRFRLPPVGSPSYQVIYPPVKFSIRNKGGYKPHIEGLKPTSRIEQSNSSYSDDNSRRSPSAQR